MCDLQLRVGPKYLGRRVEIGPGEAVFRAPRRCCGETQRQTVDAEVLVARHAVEEGRMAA
jgi:hypothetical protein